MARTTGAEDLETPAAVAALVAALPAPTALLGVVDGVLRCLARSAAFAACVGREAAPGSPWSELLGEAAAAALEPALARALAGERVDCELPGPSGPLRATLVPHPAGPDGRGLIVQLEERAAQGAGSSLVETLRHERLLTTALDHVPVGVVLAEPSGRVLFRNPAAARLLAHDLLAVRSLADYGALGAVHPDGSPLAPDEYPLPRALATGRAEVVEVLYRGGDEVLRTLRVGTGPIHDAQGVPIGAIAAFVDVSERRAVEEALGASEAEFRAIFELSASGKVVVDPASGRFVRVNQRYCEITGRSEQELLGSTLLEVGHPDDRAQDQAAIEPVLRGERESWSREQRTLRPDGAVAWALVSGSLIRDREGRPFRVVAVAQDVTERKRMEEALRASEAEFRAIFELSASGKAVVDPASGRFLRVNRRFCELTGRSEEELLGRSFREISHPDDQAEDDEVVATSAQREAWSREKRYLRPDGSIVWVLVSAATIRDGEGRPRSVIAVINDITERKAFEEALRRANRRLREVLGSITEAYLELDRDLRLLDANHVVTEMLGKPLEEVIGRPFHELFPAAVGSEFWSQYQAALADGRPRHFEAHSTLAPRWFEVHAYPREARLDVYFRDVTGRYEAAAEHRRHQERLQRLTDAVPAVVWRADAEGRVTYFNQRWYELTGLEEASSLGDGWLVAVHPDDRERAVASWNEAVARGAGPLELETRVRRADGSWRWVFTRAVPVRDAEGRAEGWFGTSTDVEDRRRAEAALRDADRRKDEFLAMLGHELRNPLAPIRSAVELLRLGSADPAAVAKARDVIDRQAQQLTRLVEDLLDVSRVTTGKIRLNLEPLDARWLVEQAVDGARPLLDGRAQELAVEVPTSPVPVRVDAVRLLQVLGNLLSNASKYTPERGGITLSLERLGPDVLLRVRDTGVGLRPDMLEQIFEPFTQAERSLDRSEGGLGIGLTLARRLVTLHGGAIWATSAGPGQGTEVTIRLPVRASEPAAAAPTPAPAGPAPPAPAGLSILVVDDNEDAAWALRELLELLGHEVRVASDGHAALRTIAERVPAVVLLDIGLPGLDGYATAEAVRARWGHASTLIAVTGYGQDSDRERARAAGFDRHLVKPVAVHELEKLLGELASAA